VCAWRVSGDLLGVKQVSLRVARRQRQLRERFSVQTQTPLGHLLPLLRDVASGSSRPSFPGGQTPDQRLNVLNRTLQKREYVYFVQI
jgi:hypothetical protein